VQKLQELTPHLPKRDDRASPGEILKMLRHRSGLTQAQLAELLGLKSARMVRNWEGEFNLPTAERLRHLITIYLERQVFVAGKEREEVRELWQAVKSWFESQNFNSESYPIFDEGWFAALIQKTQPKEPVIFSQFQDFKAREGWSKVVPYSLPPEHNRLLGREQDLARLVELLGQDGKRLITLSGAGGSRKTSLALAVGKPLLETFADGIYFVALENVTTRESLIAEITRTLSVKEIAGQPLLQSLKEHLKEKQLLLILDNFEQLVSEAGLLSELLKEAPELKLLVTSRIPLQLSFEREYPVGPLALPDKEAATTHTPDEIVTEYPGIALFIERAKAVKPDFGLNKENAPAVVEICRRLDGLPLALELAAARVRALSPQKLLERLSLKLLVGGAKDLPTRQQTLRETIGWSYELLTTGEQQLFARLAIFAGGCTLEAAEAVCNPEGDLAIEVFQGLESLLTKNLLKRWEGQDGETRYGMLVTIREFGLDKLTEWGESETLTENYTDYYLIWTRELEKLRGTAKDLDFWKIIDSEYENFMTVLEHAFESGKAEVALELTGSLGLYWGMRGHYKVGQSYLKRALDLPFSSLASVGSLRAKILWRIGWMAGWQGEPEVARRFSEEALALYRELNDKSGIVYALNGLVNEILGQGEYDKARQYLEEMLVLSKELNDKRAMHYALNNLGGIAADRGEYAEARRYFDEGMAWNQEMGFIGGIVDSHESLGVLALNEGKYAEARRHFEENLAPTKELGFNLARPLFELGMVALCQGEYAEARQLLEEGLLINQEWGHNLFRAFALHMLGLVALCQGEYAEARPLLEESLTLVRKLDYKALINVLLTPLGLVALNQGKYAEARSLLEESLVLCQRMGLKFGLAQALSGWASLITRQWQEIEPLNASTTLQYLIKVARLGGFISALLTSMGAVMWRPLPEVYQQNLDLARSSLDVATFEAAFADGQAMSVGEAVAYALAEFNIQNQVA